MGIVIPTIIYNLQEIFFLFLWEMSLYLNEGWNSIYIRANYLSFLNTITNNKTFSYKKQSIEIKYVFINFLSCTIKLSIQMLLFSFIQVF
jgi:hypothetical protein